MRISVVRFVARRSSPWIVRFVRAIDDARETMSTTEIRIGGAR